jgi:colicin import membrane protein
MTAIAARVLPRRRDHDAAPAFLAALVMHAALVGWMWFAVQWRTNASPPAVAELWQLAPLAEPAVEPPAPPTAPIPPPPSEQPTPPKADIVQKQQAPRRPVESPRKETPTKRDTKAKQTPPTREELRRQQAQAEKQHQQEMARLTQQAGVVSRTPAPASVGPISNEYSAKIQAAVRAHLYFAVPEGVPPSVYAEFEVDLLPTGEQAAEPRLVKPSGLPGFDEAARRAILRTDPFPRRDDGTVPRSFHLLLYPQDAR